MTNMQEGYVKRASLKESLIKAINESGLSAYEITSIVEKIYNEVAMLARQEEEQSIAIFNQEQNQVQEETVVEENLTNEKTIIEEDLINEETIVEE